MAFDGIVGRSLCITTTLSPPDFTLFCAPLGVTLVTITPQQLCIVKDEIETHKYSSSQSRLMCSMICDLSRTKQKTFHLHHVNYKILIKLWVKFIFSVPHVSLKK